jgi:hypothetical protein
MGTILDAFAICHSRSDFDRESRLKPIEIMDARLSHSGMTNRICECIIIGYRREEDPWNVLQNGAKSIAPVPIPLATSGAVAVPVSSITEAREKFPAASSLLQESGVTTVRPKISSGRK